MGSVVRRIRRRIAPEHRACYPAFPGQEAVVDRSSPGGANGGRRPWLPAAEMTFTMGDLPEVRQFTEGWAWQAGMSAAAVTDFVIAVNEIAANAVRHGSPQAGLRLQVAADAVSAEIRDNGHWSLAMPPV